MIIEKIVMNTPEKIVQTYLRLNGFFTIPHFSVLQDEWTHVDFLAVRLGGSVEKVRKDKREFSLKIDTDFLKKLSIGEEDTVGLVIEVKGGNERAVIRKSTFDYVKPFLARSPKYVK